MAFNLAAVFEEFNAILVLCPCCGEVFRLADGRPYVKGRKPSSPFDTVETQARKMVRAEQRFEDREEAIREKSREAGQRRARRHLRRIDPVFSGRNLDTQDVKVIFDPVDYVVFDGMTNGACRRVLLLAKPPGSRSTEKAIRSISRAVKGGDYEFGVVRVGKDGGLAWQPAGDRDE